MRKGKGSPLFTLTSPHGPTFPPFLDLFASTRSGRVSPTQTPGGGERVERGSLLGVAREGRRRPNRSAVHPTAKPRVGSAHTEGPESLTSCRRVRRPRRLRGWVAPVTPAPPLPSRVELALSAHRSGGPKPRPTKTSTGLKVGLSRLVRIIFR